MIITFNSIYRKREKNLTELLNNAVKQQNSILESTSDLGKDNMMCR